MKKAIFSLAILAIALMSCDTNGNKTAITATVPEPTVAAKPAQKPVERNLIEGTRIDRQESDKILAAIHQTFAKLQKLPKSKTWANGTSCLGVGDHQMALIGNTYYELYVDTCDEFKIATFYFRKAANSENGFPVERVIFHYDYVTGAGAIDCRNYEVPGRGKEERDESICKQRMETMLAMKDKIIAGAY